ncbi:MAG: GNAT family N-acetyltransferase [Alphaproteobacteria bacterium]|nr:GNAT family N-acetyltransferase [Alphaproteobacteria bacterium]
MSSASTEAAPGPAEARLGSVVIRFTRSAEDLAARVAMARRVYEERDDGLPYDEDMIRGALERRLKRPDGCLLQAELDGRVIGGVVGSIGPHYHSPALAALLESFYVLPEHRGSIAFVKLLHAFRRWAATNGAVRMYVCVTSGVEIARTDRLLKRLGFEPTGGNYRLSL